MYAAAKPLSRSLEDYLETIFLLQREHQVARAKEIADRLGVRQASVTGALRSLAGKGLINYAPYEFVTLTATGEKTAREVLRRHNTIKRFLSALLGLEDEVAETEACKMEHALSKPVRERLMRFMEFVDLCPRTGADWLSGFRHFWSDHEFRQDCTECVAACAEQLRQAENAAEGGGSSRTKGA